MKKSKKGSCISFLTGSCRDDGALDLMKISYKKEGDRRQKLQKLLQKYDEIHSMERNHVRQIKASIICIQELKDAPPVSKNRFLVDPNIYVDNNLTIQTREFLCMLLNTFYKRYSQNQEYEQEAAKTNQNIKALLKSISNNEELLFKVQKSNINSQVQMEGELLSEKARLKEVTLKGKELSNQQNRVKVIWIQRKAQYSEQKQKVDSLNQIMLDLEGKVIGLTQKIHEGEEIKQGNQDKLTGEMAYQAKFQEQVKSLKQSIHDQYKRESLLKKKIKQKKLKIDKLKGKINYDNSRHQVALKILQLNEVRQSTKYSGVHELLQIQKTFERAMSRSCTSTFAQVNLNENV